MALPEPVMEDGVSCGNGFLDAESGSRVHNPPVDDDMVPVRTMMPRSVMVTVVLIKMVEHLWSQSWPMERSELERRDEKMSVRRAEVGRPGILNRPVCVLDMVAPSGRAMAMLF
jgi:hypothetical protein